MKLQTVLFGMFWGCTVQEASPYIVKSMDTAEEVSVDSAEETVVDTEDSDSGQDTDSGTQQDTDTGFDPNSIEIKGNYTDINSVVHRITNTDYRISYSSGEYLYEYVQFSNAQRWVITMNATQNGEEGGSYSRFDWTIDTTGKVWVCQSTNSAESFSQAQNTPASNAFDMASGCSGSAWVGLNRQ